MSKNDEKTITLTVRAVKVLVELALLCLYLRPQEVTIAKAKLLKELSNRIEKAEKENDR